MVAHVLLLAILAPLVQEEGVKEAGVREVLGLKYYKGEDFNNRKHRLDLYLPEGKKKVPVIMWIHGGGWRQGDKGLYRRLGRRYAREGLGLAAISYRLSPKVKHPDHIRDCARAFAWLHRNVKEHGGDPDRLFIMGHSAGGHLAALLALDRKYLEEQEVPAKAVKGVIPMSGVYDIPALPKGTKGVMGMFPQAFGSDPEKCREASPLTYVSKAVAPMLVITETNDTYKLRPTMRAFKATAEEAGVKNLTFIDAEERTHITIVVKMATEKDDPSRAHVVTFVRKRCRELDSSK